MPFKKGAGCEIGDAFLTSSSMDKHCPSTLLSMDSSASYAHDELDLKMNRHVILTLPPDINLPLSSERSSPPQHWNLEHCNILEVGLGSQMYETESLLSVPKVIGRKYAKRVDSIWGAWFFFSFYFKPVLNEKSKAKIIHDCNGVSGFKNSDLELDVFMVQHDMENMYMWVFKERPENALGKMQLRSYLNGHSRQGERLFPFSADKGFVRSHKMQRKHYRGLSNPQCVHGIEVVSCPNLKGPNEDDHRRWRELTGRDLNLAIPPEAGDYSAWRNLPNTEFELEKLHPLMKINPHSQLKKQPNLLHLSTQPSNHSNRDDLSPVSNKRKKDSLSPGSDNDCCVTVDASDRNPLIELHPRKPHWLNEFSGVLRSVYGPVTAAKTIYEDEEGYLIMISLSFVDLHTESFLEEHPYTWDYQGILCKYVSLTVYQEKQQDLKLTDSDHCPPGEFIREIPLSSRIPEDAKIEAYYDGPGTVLEILVPKPHDVPEEHEVHICVRPWSAILC